MISGRLVENSAIISIETAASIAIIISFTVASATIGVIGEMACDSNGLMPVVCASTGFSLGLLYAALKLSQES